MTVVDEDRIPVIVAAGQCLERTATVTALDMAQRASEEAFALAPALRSRIDRVSVVNILSSAPKAAATVLSRRLGVVADRCEVTTIGGNTPQWLVSRAAADISAGKLRSTLIAGGEAQRSQRIGPVDDGPDDGADGPDALVGDDRVGVGPAELNAGLIAPVHVYALFESVLAHRAGLDFPEHRQRLGHLMAPFTDVAAGHPVAWFPKRRTPSELSELQKDNRLVAEPYPKRMCAVLHVDQGSAVIVTSLAEARRAGVAGRAVFCLSGAQVSDVWFPTARPDPGSSPAMAAAAGAALAAAGLSIDDISAFDLYSCFPCVIEMAVEALGLSAGDARALTVTGGLPYFGGPGNAYTLHAIATMTDSLRLHGGTGLVSGLGWYATKHAYGVYASVPSPAGWRSGEVEAAQAEIDAGTVGIAGTHEGLATVVASTVVAGHHGAAIAAPIVARLPDGRHLAAAADVEELPSLAGRNLVGTQVSLTGDPPRYRVEG